VPIPAANTNCSNGSATIAGVFTCSACALGYSLSAGVCSAISSTYTNCTATTTSGGATTCTACTSGYSLAVGAATCVANPSGNANLVSCMWG